MREAALPEVQTERTIENHGAHCRCTTCELNITEDSIRALDPATIVREAPATIVREAVGKALNALNALLDRQLDPHQNNA